MILHHPLLSFFFTLYRFFFSGWGNRYQIEALPTLILFNKGEIVDKYMGYRSADDLEKEVQKSLSRIKNQ